MQSEFNLNDREPYLCFQQSPILATFESVQTPYESPLLAQHPQSAGYYGYGSLVSPPITPMDCHSFAAQMMATPVKIDVDDRYTEYPLTPFTPTYAQHLQLPDPQSEPSRRPVSAGRPYPQQDVFVHGSTSEGFALKRTLSLNSTRYADNSDSPSRVGSASPTEIKRPTYAKWTAEEDEMLRKAVAIHGTSKWSLVASMVTGRTSMQCSTRWQGALNTNIHKGKWEPDEDSILRSAVEEWKLTHPPRSPSDSDEDDHQENIPWAEIAKMLPRARTGIQCHARWSEALDPTVRKGKWTPEEDDMLSGGVREFGRCWIKVASRVRGRTQRQIRTRWMQLYGRDQRAR
jgi:Myb-like DNA-binding domain